MKALTNENLKEYLNEQIAMIIEKRNNLDCQEDCRKQVFERLGNCINAIKFISDNFEKEFGETRVYAAIWDSFDAEDKNNGRAIDFINWLDPEHKGERK
ncbi:MAG: hypothetical protein RRZ69_01505 [Clostridia bacterium]